MEPDKSNPWASPIMGLALAAIVTGVNGCASGPFSSNLNQSPPSSHSAWRGGDNPVPVYTSPDETPVNNNLPNPPD